MATVQIQRILVALDGSPNSERALDYGADLARRLNSQLGLVTVADPLPAIGTEMIPNVSLLEELRKEARDTLDIAAKRFDPPPARFLRDGRPDFEVCHCAQEWKASLLVIGTHGRTGLQRVLMGSVAEHIVRHAPCPVLVVRPILGG